MRSSKSLVITFLVLLLGVLPASGIIYAQAYKLEGKQTKRPITLIDNEAVLQNLLPQSVIDVMKKQLLAYASAQALPADYFTVDGAITKENGGYNFELKPDEGDDNLKLKIVVEDSNSITEVTTSINGAVQDAIEDTNQTTSDL